MGVEVQQTNGPNEDGAKGTSEAARNSSDLAPLKSVQAGARSTSPPKNTKSEGDLPTFAAKSGVGVATKKADFRTTRAKYLSSPDGADAGKGRKMSISAVRIAPSFMDPMSPRS